MSSSIARRASVALLTLLAAAFGGAIRGGQTSDVPFKVSMDAHVREDQPTNLYGSESLLHVGDAASNPGSYVAHRIYLKFDLRYISHEPPPYDTTIDKAVLKLYCKAKGESIAVEAMVSPEDWNESNLNWNRQADWNLSDTNHNDFVNLADTHDSRSWFEWNVTTAVRQAHSQPSDDILSLVLIDKNESAPFDGQWCDFWSKEAAGWEPYLEVTLTQPDPIQPRPPPQFPGLTPGGVAALVGLVLAVGAGGLLRR